MRGLLFAALLAAPAAVLAQELVTVPTRPGVTQSFFIPEMGGRKAEAIALMYIGGYGNINLRSEGGVVKFGAEQLPASRPARVHPQRRAARDPGHAVGCAGRRG